MGEFVALRNIAAPGTLTLGYTPGHDVPARVVSEWNLVVGEDVEEGDGGSGDDEDAPRPADDDHNRASWEAYVRGQGTSAVTAREASLDELKGMYPPPEKPVWQVADEKAAAKAKTADSKVDDDAKAPAKKIPAKES